MGEFIVVLKYIHFHHLFFDLIVITQSPTVWIEKWWNIDLCQILI